MGPTLSSPRINIVRTKPRGDSMNPTTEYSALLHTVRDAGLLRRRTGYYSILFGAMLLAIGGEITGFIMLRGTWYELLIAAGMGIILTQLAFLAHESAHRQVFESGPANDWVGRTIANLMIGISYTWWDRKHSRHHANPNLIGKDPDIERDFVSFTDEDAARARGLHAWFTRRQGTLLVPMLLFEGINLHIHSFRTVFGKDRVDKRWIEISMVVPRVALYFTGIFFVLPLGMAFAFIGVQLAVFGLYMGASFAVNHTGMPVLPRDTKLDFLRRQVLTSRNISGGTPMALFMGGINYQVEHHLFPNMPRPHLKAARVIAREYCEANDILYTETGLLHAYRAVIRHLDLVGQAAKFDPFDCPAARAFGR
jgi:fatty acid desaturase